MKNQGNNKTKERKFTNKEKAFILKKTSCKCARCGQALDVINMTIDHIFPKSKGGLDDEYNLLPLCYDCNEKKSNFVYSIRNFYKYIIEEEIEAFMMYNNYATFDYTKKSILGWDEMTIGYYPDASLLLMQQMQKRKKKKSTAYRNLIAQAPIRKAYPGDAKDIYNVMLKYEKLFNQKFTSSTIYKNDTAFLNAIENGEVYVIEKNKDICGAFVFEPYTMIMQDYMPVQLQNIMEHSNLSPKYVMTLAATTYSLNDAFNPIMIALEDFQIQNGWMPLYFDILSPMYIKKSNCIFIPSQINGVEGKLEFKTYDEMLRLQNSMVERICEDYGYDLDDYEKKLFAEYIITKKLQSEFKNNLEAEDFFKKYPNLMLFFKPESYEPYGAGLDIRKEK